MQSLPYPADHEIVKRALEECNGKIDDAYTKLVDTEERGSVSSQPGSSSTERDPDSDDDALNGPNKKQDRRMSRATKTARKVKALQEKKKRDAAPAAITKVEIKDEITPDNASREIMIIAASDEAKDSGSEPPSLVKDSGNEDDDDFDPPSEDGEDDDFRPELEDDVTSEYSSTTRTQLRSAAKSLSPPPTQSSRALPPPRGAQSVPSLKPKRVTAREKVELKKQAQKAARKESKRNAIGSAKAARRLGAVPSVNVKQNAPAMELGMGIKTLYI